MKQNKTLINKHEKNVKKHETKQNIKQNMKQNINMKPKIKQQNKTEYILKLNTILNAMAIKHF